MNKVLLAFYVTVFCCIAAAAAPSHCSAEIYTETCGEHASWSYNTKTKVLKISGTGAVTETIAAGEKKGCWGEEKSLRVKKIIIAEGITSLNCPSRGLFEHVTYNSEKKKVTIKLPDSLESIGSFSFYLWNEDLVIPKNVKYIAPAAIETGDRDSGCSLSVAKDNPYFCMVGGVLFSKDQKKLVYYPQDKTQKEYTVPRSVREIAPLAFRGVQHLESVVLPDELKELGSGAFYGCANLKSVNLSDKMKIKSITDYDTTKLMGNWDILDDDNSVFYRKEGAPYSGKANASECRAGTFEGTSLESIHIPNSVQYISSNTFFNNPYRYMCTYLQEISFGSDFSGEINLGDSQDGMETLTLNDWNNVKIDMPENNKKYCVEDGILYSKDKTVLYLASNYEGKTLEIPKSVKVIANGAFLENYKIKHIIISGDIESIGYNAFANAEIKTFICKGEIREMGENAFAGCSGLKKVEIKKLKEIPESAFSGCQALKAADFGLEVEWIWRWAFDGCSALSKLTLGKQLRLIGAGAFELGFDGENEKNIPAVQSVLENNPNAQFVSEKFNRIPFANRT